LLVQSYYQVAGPKLLSSVNAENAENAESTFKLLFDKETRKGNRKLY
jgi:hypothetical protein